MGHNEKICHEAGERRQNYLNQIKCILEKMDDTPCVKETGGTVAGQESGEKPLLEYPGYINRLNPKFNKPFYEPLIPNVMLERRLYCDTEGREFKKPALPDVCQGILTGEELKANLSHASPIHSLRSKPAELKMGYMVQGCDCRKHNGLQDQCERSECFGRPACLTQPDPTCGPAQTYVTQPLQPTREELIDHAVATWPKPKLQYCCCTPDCGSGVETYGKQPTASTNYACFPCSQ